MAIQYGPPPIITNGLVYALDAGNTRCYISGSATCENMIKSVEPDSYGTLTNDPLPSTDGGGSWAFDGTDDYIETDAPLSVLSGKTNLTISTWFKIDVLETVKIWGNNESVNQYLDIFIVYDSTVYFEYAAGTNIYATKATPSTWLPAGNWCDLTLVYDASESTNATKVKLYKNGELQSWTGTPGTFVATSTSLGVLKLGSDSFQIYYFDGNIAKFSVYNRSLSAAEVLQNFNAQRSRFGI